MCGPNRRKIETEAVGSTKDHVSEVFLALEKTLETEAVGDIKKRISEVFRGLEKMLAWVYYIWEGSYIEGHKIVIDK